jgi:hypothetical protein
MRVAKLILVVEPGTGRTGKLAMVAYQFQHDIFLMVVSKMVSVVIFSHERVFFLGSRTRAVVARE